MRATRRTVATVACALVGVAAPQAIATSPTAASVPAPIGTLAFAVSPVMVPPGSPVVARATTDPRLAGSSISLQVDVSGWETVATTSVTSSGDAAFAFVAPSSVGVRSYRAVLHPLAEETIGLESDPATLTVADHGPGSSRDYTFEKTYAGRPVRWDPCHVIRVRENVARAPSQARADLAEALRRVTLLTGIRFAYAGSTRQPSASGRFAYPADTDLIVSWASPDQVRFPSTGAGDVEGATLPEGRYVRGRPRWTHAGIMINASASAGLAYGFGSGPTLGGVLLHELGHALGLAHNAGRYEMMYPSVRSDTAAAIYGAGDAAGLRLLGRTAGCLR